MGYPNLNKIRDHIRDFLSSRVVGYQLFIADQSRPPATGLKADRYGYAVRPLDPILAQKHPTKLLKGFEMTGSRRLEVESMSKTITAAAVMKLIADDENRPPEKQVIKGNLAAKIVQFLPDASEWKRGPRIENLTIQHLLQHRSGLSEYNEVHQRILRKPPFQSGQGRPPAWIENIKSTIEHGIPDENLESPSGIYLPQLSGVEWPHLPAKYWYQNVNYALFRVMIPFMLSPGFSLLLFKAFGDENFINGILGSTYVTFVRDNVLMPCGISGADIIAKNTDSENRYYLFEDESKVRSDSDEGDPLRSAGAANWKLSALEYCKFLTGLSSGAIFPVKWWKLMRQLELGMKRVNGKHGTYVGHNGVGNYRQTGWLWAPGVDDPNKGLVIVVVTNSRNEVDDVLKEGGPGMVRGLLKAAYDDSF